MNKNTENPISQNLNNLTELMAGQENNFQYGELEIDAVKIIRHNTSDLVEQITERDLLTDIKFGTNIKPVGKDTKGFLILESRNEYQLKFGMTKNGGNNLIFKNALGGGLCFNLKRLRSELKKSEIQYDSKIGFNIILDENGVENFCIETESEGVIPLFNLDAEFLNLRKNVDVLAEKDVLTNLAKIQATEWAFGMMLSGGFNGKPFRTPDFVKKYG